MARTDDDSSDGEQREHRQEFDGEPDVDVADQFSKIVIPPSPTVPPPPDIKIERPDFNRSQPDRPTHTTTVRIGADRPRHVSPNNSQLAENAGAWGSGLGASITFAASVIVGFLIGQFVDHKFGWAKGGVPWGTIVFGLAGIAAGFVNLFKLLAIGDRNRKQ